MTKRIHTLLLLASALWLSLTASAQLEEPVVFTISQQRLSPTELQLTFSGDIDEGWHVYSSDMAGNGPTVAAINIDKIEGLEPLGKLAAAAPVKEGYDSMFDMTVRYMEGKAKFVQRFRITAQHYGASGYLEYGACNDKHCMPPTQVDFSFNGSDGPAAAKDADATVAATIGNSVDATATAADMPAETTDSAAVATAADTDSIMGAAWTPVGAELKAMDESRSNGSLLSIFLLGLLGGLLAVITPCVWPIIPMTVSYFLKRSEHSRKGVRDALLYGLSIIIIYVGLGLLVTLIYDSNKLNELSTNSWFNLFCFGVLVVFAASFLGGFELTLPSSWGNKTDRKAESAGGFLGIFLMAVTLCIVSFSCTGPIIGFLLVDISTAANYLAPAIGMLGFAIALALPFTLFALFPSLIKKAPRSGGWMNTVKATLGFIELAFALKFFSVADMAYGWGLLSRETFLALWIALFLMLGLYLLGMLRLPHDPDRKHTSIPTFFCGWMSIAFAVYMIPGLWGAPLKAISAFTPPMATQDFNVNPSAAVHPATTDYDEALRLSRETGKPILLDFTGYGCVNCRKMEAAVWTEPEIASLIDREFVLASLYVDDKTPLDTALTVTIDGRQKTLRTVADKWSLLQKHKFGANTQPFYVIIDADGRPLAPPYSYDEDVAAYRKFLQKGLEKRH